MLIGRRLYVYLLAGVSLAFVLIGLQSLVRILLDSLGLGGDVVAGDLDVSARLSGALALVGVGTPVWLLHWWFAERSIRPERNGSEAERQSAIRALYFALVLGILLAVAASATAELIGRIIAPASEFAFYSSSIGGVVASILVAGAAWAYHAALRRRDLSGALLDAAAWMPRAYLYGAAFLAAVWALTAIVPITQAAIGAIFGRPLDQFLWVGSVGAAVVGTIIWIGHAWYAGRLRNDAGWRGASERPARIRLAYLVALIAVGVAGTVTLATAALEPALAAALGGGGPTELIAPQVVASAVAMVPFAVAGWWFHARRLRREGREEVAPGRPALNWRLEHVAVSLTALAFAASATARLIAITLDAVFGPPPVVGSGTAITEAATMVPWAVIGGAIWLWAWIPVERRREADPTGEAASTVRRAALLIVLAVSVIAGLATVALLLYRLFGFILGAGLSGDALVELSTPAGILVVALVGGLYHGLALRRDLALAPPPAPDAVAAEAEVVADEVEVVAAEAGEWESEGGVVISPALVLTLRGPNGADMDAALEAARQALPEGYRLERD